MECFINLEIIHRSLILGVSKYLQAVGQDVEAIKIGQQETRNGER